MHDDPTLLNELSQEMIEEAAKMMDRNANQMIVILANLFANAVRQITESIDDSDIPAS